MGVGGLERKKTGARCLGRTLSPAGTIATDTVTKLSVQDPSDWKLGRWLVRRVLTHAAQKRVGERGAWMGKWEGGAECSGR